MMSERGKKGKRGKAWGKVSTFIDKGVNLEERWQWSLKESITREANNEL